MKEVRFDIYCKICVYHKLKENEEPCCDCLAVPGKDCSRVPEYFKEVEGNDGN